VRKAGPLNKSIDYFPGGEPTKKRCLGHIIRNIRLVTWRGHKRLSSDVETWSPARYKTETVLCMVLSLSPLTGRLMGWSTKRAFSSKMFAFVIFLPRAFALLMRHRDRKMPPMYSTGAPSSGSTPDSAPPHTDIPHKREDYYELAQRLHPLLPHTCNQLVSGDVQIIDTAPYALGGFSEVWGGSLQGRPVVVKSLRLFSCPEFDPAEVGIVSPHPSSWAETVLTAYSQRFLVEASASNQLSHPNIVPFIGVYSTPNHPLALVYEMMKNDLGEYLVEHPDVSRLKLVSKNVLCRIGQEPLMTPCFSSLPASWVR